MRQPITEQLLRDQHLEFITDQLTEQSYAVVDGWLLAGELDQLRALADQLREQGEFQRAGIGRANDYQLKQEVRGDLIHWLDPHDPHPATANFFAGLDQLVQHLNRTLFLGLQSLEMHLAIYPAGTRYQRHLDVFQTDGSRRLSAICYLNDDWTPDDGGQLRMYLPGPDGQETTLDIVPRGGRLVLFLSDLLEHEVLPARRARYSITGWLRRQASPFPLA